MLIYLRTMVTPFGDCGFSVRLIAKQMRLIAGQDESRCCLFGRGGLIATFEFHGCFSGKAEKTKRLFERRIKTTIKRCIYLLKGVKEKLGERMAMRSNYNGSLGGPRAKRRVRKGRARRGGKKNLTLKILFSLPPGKGKM